MARIILHRSFNPPEDFDPTLHPCLAERGVIWIRSFVALDNSYSICELEAPYTEIVRDGCRQAGLAYDAIWRAEVWQNKDRLFSSTCSNPILSEVDYDIPLTNEQWSSLRNSAQPCFQEHQIEGLCSLIAPDRRQSLCIFDAASAEIVRQAHRKAGIRFRRIWRSLLITPQHFYK
jgi:hypothetical protein